jgi:NADH-quinone oxidoreductase subunit M
MWHIPQYSASATHRYNDPAIAMTHLLTWTTYAPLATALVLLGVPARHLRLIRALATAAATTTAVLSLIVWFGFEPRGAEWQFVETLVRWPSVGASYTVGVDGLGATFVLMTAMACWIAVVCSWTAVGERAKQHYATLLTLETAMLVVFTSLDLLIWIAFWFVAVVATWQLGRLQRRAVMATGIASIAVLAGVVSLYFSVHALSNVYTFDVRMLQHVTLAPTTQRGVFVVFALGFAIVAGWFPFHVWQRDAQVESDSIVSFLIAVVVAKLGTYGVLRVSLPMLPHAARVFAIPMVLLSLVGVAVCAIAACLQSDWRRLTSYVSLGLIAMMVGSAFGLTPRALTTSSMLQVAQCVSIGALLVVSEMIRARGSVTVPAMLQPVAVVTVLGATALTAVFPPGRLFTRVETSIARVVLRVSPERASEVSDCLTNPQAPPKVDPGLPAGISAMAPCTDEKPVVPK